MPSAQLFPHLSSTGAPPLYYDVRAAYIKYFHDRVKEGSVRPLVPHYHLGGMFLLLAYLSIPHTTRPWLYKARWVVLAIITWHSWKTAWETSSQSAGVALVASLVSAWSWVMGCVWLVFCRPQFEAKRVEKRIIRAPATEKKESEEQNISNADFASEADGVGHEISSNVAAGNQANGISTIKHRSKKLHRQNGHSDPEVKGEVYENTVVSSKEYFWQTYPDTFGERLNWATDLLVNFRGPGWNWAIPTLPSPPISITEQVGEFDKESARTAISTTGVRRFDTREEVFRFYVPRFIAYYFIADFIKVLMMKDPYFLFGPTTYALPPYLASLSPVSLLLFRETLSGAGIVILIEMAFQQAPLGFCLFLGPRVLGQRADPWYYATSWGSFSNILDKGLAGLWGRWWHQTFRFCFSAPTQFFIRNNYVSAHSKYAKLVGGLFAFGISGLLHSAGSVSQIAHTKPLNSMLFFMMQALGISLQTTFCGVFKSSIASLPKTMRRTGNFAFVMTWLLSTGWLLADDFARGGVWLVEPLPISPLRGLGFGVEGDSWWAWSEMGSGWYSGNHWWESGLALF
ncbi:hypothetical protein GLAREA_04925 [Glarea lozoyensis ATCC 20868]|uniref:Wax synthase domain-containing protein n=1 Tax=Glarea lozoyensis (strain ATCC 20868 / MF5171) TaxID=1116229 RepID=S3CSS4_GLAL2|nr:uncharacterized protein GLAREA_04925 [Glarea lozoyensis ATCC 20868]EPE28134.1 hypothetical protein GLAREA_04925 [Glarea lozoyensis ATCC 20868]